LLPPTGRYAPFSINQARLLVQIARFSEITIASRHESHRPQNFRNNREQNTDMTGSSLKHGMSATADRLT